MKKCLLLALLLSGCVSHTVQPSDIPITAEAITGYVQHLTFVPPEDVQGFRVSPHNKYAIIIPGRLWEKKADYMLSVEHLVTLHTPMYDQFVDEDVNQMTRLLTNKDYDTYILDMRQMHDESYLYWLIYEISRVSNDNTKLVISMSGKGTANGFNMGSMFLADINQCISPAYSTIKPDKLFESLSKYKGATAIFASMCEGGVFARIPRDFDGIVIAACDIGYATVPYEATGTTVLISGIISLFKEDGVTVFKEIDLDEDTEIPMGDSVNRASHHLLLGTEGKLVVSYEPVIKGKFRF